MAKTDDPSISIGRDDAQVKPGPEEDVGAPRGKGHPLPNSDKARHGTIPERIEHERGQGDD